MKYLKKNKPNINLAILAIGLSIFGVIMITSASAVVAYEKYGESGDYYFVYHQLIALVIGIVLMAVFSNIEYYNLKKKAFTLLLITLGLILLVFLPGIGMEVNGARRWINLGITSFQPTELLKITFAIYLSAWLDNRQSNLDNARNTIVPFVAMIALLAGLIMLQPDLGTLTIIVLTAIIILYSSGTSTWQLGSLALFFMAIFFIFVRSAEYRWRRLMTFINPSAQTLDQGYHINQAFIAVSQGGLLGKGFGGSLQKLRYLPEPHTDSIFAIIAEELGFLRSSIVVIAYTYLAMIGLRISKEAPDLFGKLLALGLTSSIVIQAFVNIAAMLGLVPLTGATLPFISFGGTSLIITFIQIGILLNISKHAIKA